MKRIFISYAKEDGITAARLAKDLRHNGLDPWLDSEQIKPGQVWRDQILEAIGSSRYFLALLSSSSVNKRGYVQLELREALEVLDTFSPSHIFIIPVRVNECRPGHRRLETLQWVDLFPSYQEGMRKLLSVFRSPKALDEAVILWIDDNHANNQLQIEAWRSKGITVLLAGATTEALKLLEEYQFDVIVSDLFRDEEGRYHAAGYELLKHLSENHINIPVIIYTASIEAVDRQKARTAYGIAEAPFQVNQLVLAALAGDR